MPAFSKPLEKVKEKEFQVLVEDLVELPTFYHFFPLIYAISESTAKLYIDDTYRLWVSPEGTELYLDPFTETIPDFTTKVWTSLRPAPKDSLFHTELYDTNYIYDTKYTLGIKNFRDLKKAFWRKSKEKDFPKISVERKPLHPEDPFQVIRNWYNKGSRQSYSDFGYTLWLANEYEKFDLKPILVYAEDQPIAFSLWGVLNDRTAIHLICKENGWSYLQDYIRYITYEDILAEGLPLINDGGDADIDGLRIYKTKLRPKFIIPIYSWCKK